MISNTALTKLNLSGEDKRKKTQVKSRISSLFSYLSQDNRIGDNGLKSLSEALKSNTTLQIVNLNGKYEGRHTNIFPINKPHHQKTGSEIQERHI